MLFCPPYSLRFLLPAIQALTSAEASLTALLPLPLNAGSLPPVSCTVFPIAVGSLFENVSPSAPHGEWDL